jgi:hypothetical protein
MKTVEIITVLIIVGAWCLFGFWAFVLDGEPYFRRFTFSLLSPLIGFHYGRNPIDKKRFLHVAPLPFFGIDFYWPADEFTPFAKPATIQSKHNLRFPRRRA